MNIYRVLRKMDEKKNAIIGAILLIAGVIFVLDLLCAANLNFFFWLALGVVAPAITKRFTIVVVAGAILMLIIGLHVAFWGMLVGILIFVGLKYFGKYILKY